MKLDEIVKYARVKYSIELDLTEWLEKVSVTLKAPYQNNYVTIRGLRDAEKFEITFFKSQANHDNLFDDYVDFGVSFYPGSIEEVKLLFKIVDA